MKVKDNCYLKKFDGRYAIFPIQKNIDNTNTIFTLNDAGFLLWQVLQNETTEDELVSVLMAHYKINEANARRKVKIFVRELVDSKLIENFP